LVGDAQQDIPMTGKLVFFASAAHQVEPRAIL
jgi:hypothetical protein